MRDPQTLDAETFRALFTAAPLDAAAIDRVAPYYTEDVVFIDPIQTVRGRDAFLEMNKRLIARSKESGLRGDAEGSLLARMNELAAQQLGCTLGALAAGLPVYDVTFDEDDSVRVDARGSVAG